MADRWVKSMEMEGLMDPTDGWMVEMDGWWRRMDGGDGWMDDGDGWLAGWVPIQTHHQLNPPTKPHDDVGVVGSNTATVAGRRRWLLKLK